MARSVVVQVERLLTVAEVAELLSTTERFPRRLIAERRIRFVRITFTGSAETFSDRAATSYGSGGQRPISRASPVAPPRLSMTTGYGGPGHIAWRVRQRSRGEGPGNDAGVGGPACCGCGHVDRLIT